MFVQIKLIKGFSKPLLYKIPDTWNSLDIVGKIIKVPVQKRTQLAFVEKVFSQIKEEKFEIKTAISIEKFPEDKTYINFINKLSNYYQVDKSQFIKRVHQFIQEKQTETDLTKPEDLDNKKITSLTDEQKQVYEFLEKAISKNIFTPTLLHGATGSGKTEVYKRLIIDSIKQNKSVILLLPEVTLALQFEQILKKSLPDNILIFSFHSAVNAFEKRLLWEALLLKKPILIIGVHLPVLLPISNPGLIIVDEEHDVGYQEKKHPKINTKEAALLKAQLNNIPILFGSATPSITSLNNVKKYGWHFFQLKKRFAGNFPKIDIVNLNDKKQRKNFWISAKLEAAIKEKLSKKEQIIIFINRRGFSFFVQCKNCSFIFKCLNCSVSLTLHKNNWLYCHYCNLSIQYPNECKGCNADETFFLKKGIGTEQVVTILQNLFPTSIIARADLDVTSKKKLWQQILTDFKENKINILVGTQTIAKGYHFPNVTLVGILWADLNLNFPIYNASETTLQQLIQVSGRAGRQSNSSNVIIQTMIDHKIFEFINEIDYLKFYNFEIEARKDSNYPPHTRLVEIEFKNINEAILDQESINFSKLLLNLKSQQIKILGPAKPAVDKIKNNFMRKIYIKGPDINEIINLYNKIDIKKFKSKIFFTPNPIA